MACGCGAGDGAARGADRRSAGCPCRTGDHDAWRELVDRSRYVYAIAVQGFKMSEHDAEDVFQEVFTRRLRAPAQAAGRRRDSTLARAADAAALHRPAAGSATEQLDDEVEIADANDTIAAAGRLWPCMKPLGAPGQLPGDPRSLFARDESYHTIGDALELPSGTIASRISRC